MPDIVWTDRSRTETYQRCPRLRFLEYHQNGTGIAPARKPLALCVGGSVHVGLEHLLLGDTEDVAVAAALADFATHRRALALDTTELTAMTTVDPQSLESQMLATAADLGLPADDPSLVALAKQRDSASAQFDDWLWQEQASLVEGLVRAYSRRRLRPLLEEYEVLEVEREGDWELYEGVHGTNLTVVPAIRFMSRPDALLRNRNDNSLYLLSFKTAASWDIRKARDAEHDMQGLSEGVEVERRLAAWWQEMRQAGGLLNVPAGYTAAEVLPVVNFLGGVPAPPRILGIRYEYLLKGSRWQDKELSQRFGLNVWSQRSHLIRRFVAHSTPSRGKNASAFNVGDQAWSWDYHLEDGSTSKLSASNWHGEPVWEHGGSVRAWIDALDDAEETMSAYDSTTGADPRPVGWKSRAQAVGYTAQHPLDAVFVPPITVFRQDEELRNWVEQTEYQERRVAEAVAQLESTTDEGERRSLLNQHFSQTRKACEYPSTCAMSKICWGSEDLQRDPLGSGLYRRREPNHVMEKEARSHE